MDLGIIGLVVVSLAIALVLDHFETGLHVAQ